MIEEMNLKWRMRKRQNKNVYVFVVTATGYPGCKSYSLMGLICWMCFNGFVIHALILNL